MGMIQLNNSDNFKSSELTESKGSCSHFLYLDFEIFYHKSLLPKELQKVNPNLLGINSGNLMRALSPVLREVTDAEKEMIKIKYKLRYDFIC